VIILTASARVELQDASIGHHAFISIQRDRRQHDLNQGVHCGYAEQIQAEQQVAERRKQHQQQEQG
jgi:uncharacterized protein YaiL (DUF2058 family)